MSDFRYIAMGLAAYPDPGVAIAASRAGSLGVFDISLEDDPDRLAWALADLARYGRGRCGLRVSDLLVDFPWSVLESLPERVGTLTLETESETTLRNCVRLCAERDLELLVETTSLESAQQAQAAGVTGLIAKGHETGGKVGEETALILLQRLVPHVEIPVYVQGGISPHTAAACSMGGAAGVVLDWQLALTREAALPEPMRDLITRFDGGETACVGGDLGDTFRVLAFTGSSALAEIKALEATLADKSVPIDEKIAGWREFLRKRIRSASREESLVFVGQDACLAASLAARHKTVGGVLQAMEDAVVSYRSDAASLRPLAADSKLARSQGTRYPIAQGPMTRVSDNPAFALEVAKAGGLPFLALSVLRKEKVQELLEQTQQLLGDHPWGVGILGFVPLELRLEQMEAIRQVRPKFALIAGGRPDQALQLEEEGISTYLHVPSPGLLELFLAQGARKFVFEGRECGGHVGPRSSFVLWSTMIDLLLSNLSETEISDCQVLFAGGIHDALSSAIVATMATPLAQRGVGVGALMGTAYLFTQEAVETGAIVPGFQETAIACQQTVLLESAPGHATRSADSEFAGTFIQTRKDLLSRGVPGDEMQGELEELNLGRLRIAAKGIERGQSGVNGSGEPQYQEVDEEEQRLKGLYMIGQVATLRDQPLSIEALHREVSEHGSALLDSVLGEEKVPVAKTPSARPSDVAIIGMACLLPKAPDVSQYWANILNKVDSVTEVPVDRWDWNEYFDPEKKAKDKIYSKWGGFLDDIVFDPLKYAMPPNSIPSIEPLQLLTLEVARSAMADSGYLDRPFDRERASVILGAGGGVSDLGVAYSFRSSLPMMMVDASSQLLARLPEWTEDSFPGILMNVAAGRVANRLDFGGVNCTMDAACAASLAALYLSVQELETGASDLVITGGADTAQNPFMYLCFAKTQALSPSGRCRTFDQNADGIAISEGVAALVLKRLDDAERDGDRIYAVIKGVGGSSDGREKGLTAPRPAGQAKALRRAYGKAGFSPATVGLIEAHGTGTVAGDKAEVQTLKTVFQEEGSELQTCALGSVKSMIGHTKCTAGVAGLMKVALALHHKVLPPTLHVSEPNREAKFEESPFYVNTELRPWIQSDSSVPRRAGVSAFGFGGTNFHVALEEYTEAIPTAVSLALADDWPAELFLFRGETEAELLKDLDHCQAVLEAGRAPRLADLSFTFWRRARQRRETAVTLSIVARSLEDLQTKLYAARTLVAGDATESESIDVSYQKTPLARSGRVAFLFSGQGSQYPNMLTELASYFTEIRESFEIADRVLEDRFSQPLSRYIFPPIAFAPAERSRQMADLTATRVAQPALGATEIGLTRLLESLNVTPDVVAGHSYGEYMALHAAGVFDAETLLRLSELRGRVIEEEAKQGLGTMAAVTANRESVEQALEGMSEVWIANLNSPQQTVISGTDEGIEEAVRRLQVESLNASSLNVACAFHSPLVAPAADRLGKALHGEVEFSEPKCEVFSNTSANPYPTSAKSIAKQLVEHLVSPVRFADEITAMHDHGVRIFVEVGPRSVLTGLTKKILADRQAAILAIDPPEQSGMVPFLNVVGSLASHGAEIDLERLYAGRAVEKLDLAKLSKLSTEPKYPLAAWLINGGRSRPAAEPARPSAVSQPATPGVSHESEPLPMTDPTPTPASPIAFEQQPTKRPGQSQVPAASLQPKVSLPPTGDASDIVLQHQRLMSRFLETQQTIMTAFLEGQTHTPSALSLPMVDTSLPTQYLDPSVATETVAELPTPEMSPRVEDEVVPLEPEPVEVGISPAEITQLLVSVVSERTGYPAEMLKVDANITSDLGIDSIKWVEILGAFREACPPQVGDGLQTNMETLVSGKTLQEVSALTAEIAAKVQLAPSAARSTDEIADGGSQVAVPSPQELAELLVQVVSERTGYPAEMLKVDANITSDLGIDSIKWVEILGAFQQTVAAVTRERIPDSMEQLTRAKTLREVVDLLASADGESAPVAREAGPAAVVADARPQAPPTQDLRAPRFVVAAAEVAIDQGSENFRSDKAVLVVEDEGGVGDILCRLLDERRQSVVRVRRHSAVERLGDGAWGVDLSEVRQIRQLLASVREAHGALAGVIFLAPLAEPTKVEADLDAAAWKQRLEVEVKGLFHLAQTAGPDLLSAGREGTACFLSATGMGGNFGLGREIGHPIFAGQAGTVGLVKTLALEWTDVRCKAVDFDLEDSAEKLAKSILAELDGSDSEVEVGYRDSRRWVLRPYRAEPAEDSARRSRIDSESVILITGGARGITAQIAKELAARYQPKLVLLGRSPQPPDTEQAETAGIENEGELKKVLLRQLQQSGEEVTPVDLEAAFRRLTAAREIRANLAEMSSLGARVSYLQADVLDRDSLRGALTEQEKAQGKVDGLIHGAGIIDDKLLLDKSGDSFDRVFDTKVNGLLHLLELLPVSELELVVLFASVAGRFGNRGQCDYAAANEVMNRLAAQLDRQGASRVLSINWGPWQQTGMASQEVQRRFAERGVQLIGAVGGREAFIEMLEAGREEEVEVILGDGPWREFADLEDAAVDLDLPLVKHRGVSIDGNGKIELTCTLDPDQDLYLADHRLDGKPVLPAAVALEYIVEAVQKQWSDRQVVAVRDFQVLNGVILENGPKRISLETHALEEASPGTSQVEAKVELHDVSTGRHCYGAVVDLSKDRPSTPAPEFEAPTALEAFPMSVESAYDRWLFHGPVFQTIEEIQGVTESVIVGLLKPSSPRSCVSNTTSSHWLIDPVIVDGAFQLTLLFARLHTDMTPLPARFGAFRLYTDLAGSDIRCVIRARFDSGGQHLRTHTSFLSPTGDLIAVLEDAEFTSSPALNRLGGQWQRPRTA